MYSDLNPYWPYRLTNTVHFAYNGKDVWGTIMRFGNGFVTMLTKNGHRNYTWKKMEVIHHTRRCVKNLALEYAQHGTDHFKYLFDHYGID